MLPPAPVEAPSPSSPRSRPTPSLSPINASTQSRNPHITLTGILQVQQRFRDDGKRPEVELVLLPDEDGENYRLHRIDPRDRKSPSIEVPLQDGIDLHRVPDEHVCGDRIGIWGANDYMQILREYATELDMSLEDCARRYGKATVFHSDYGWWFHPALGYTRHG